jgi:hypothetical protein
MERSYPEDSDFDSFGPDRSSPERKPFSISKLQIAAILLIVVFIWGIVSAVTIAMFDIHLLALTEFEDDGRADVSGFVMDDEGRSLNNVTVVVHGTQYFTKTNHEGFYTMEDIKEGDYEIEASLEDYGSVTKRVSLNANSPTLVSFVLEEGGFDKTENERFGSNLSDLQHLNYTTAIFIVIYSSFALLGGILTYFQRYYWIAMFGALCGIISGILSIGIIVAPILSIIALLYIIKNKEDFIASEKPIADRIFKVKRAGTKPVAVGGAKPLRSKESFSPEPMKTKAKTETFDSPPIISEGTTICIACGGSVKSIAGSTTCRECGAIFHKFCADSIMQCKSCGAPL